MSFWADDRAAAVQVGAIVLFAFVVIAITAYQASVVPNQNEQVEFVHNQQIQRQLEGLQGVVGSTPTASGARTVVVDTSTSYPARTIFVNPPPPTGVLETIGTGDPAVAIEVRNAKASGETNDFWDGRTHNYTTGTITYRPNYHVYAEAPISVVENSVVYNRFDDKTIVANAQSMFDGRKITLVALNGSYREQGGAASVTVRPVSASSNRVEVEAVGSSSPVTIQIVTQFGNNPTEAADRWQTILEEAGEFDKDGSDADAYVTAVTGGNEVTLPDGSTAYQVAFELETETTYSLALAKAGVGSNVNATPSDRYATRASPRNVSTTAGTKETLAVEVRDSYNNPIAGVPMNATIETGGGSILEPNGTETDADGIVRFTYEAPDAETTARVNVSIAKAGGKAAAATFKVSVSKASSGGGGGGNGAYNVTLVNPESTNSPASAVSCPNWPSNRTCVVNGGQLSTVNVTMGTQPTASGASVTWAVNNTTVARVDPSSGQTQPNGENSTDVVLNQNGDVVVYASSGAGGNRTTLRIWGVSAAMAQPGVVFTAVSDGTLRSVGPNGVVNMYDAGKTGSISAVGPMDADLDADGKLEIPFVNENHELLVIDLDSEVQTIANPTGVENPTAQRVGVGSFRSNGPFVYYANQNSKLVRVGVSTPPALVSTDVRSGKGSDISAAAVAGTGDFDGDGSNEIVYVDPNSPAIAYVSERNNNKNEVMVTGVSVPSVSAVSDPANLDGDANEEVAYLNGGAIRLADSDGSGVQLANNATPDSGTGLATFDYVGDATEEVIYVGQNGYLRYVTVGGANGFVRNEDGDRIEAAQGPQGTG